MPAKKSKAPVAKKRPASRGGKKPKKGGKANKTKTKATKRKAQMKKKWTKTAQKKRKERKKADKAKKKTKKDAAKRKKKSKDKKKKQKAQKKAEKPKQQPASEEEDDAGNDKEGGMKFSGMSLDQLQNIRKSVAELTKDEFLEYIKNNSDHQIMEAQHMSSAEGRMKLFKDSERPTCTSRGPFQSNRFGALFLIPGHQ
ncbi:F-box domain-containing protein [Caenorhabditis elegans]|uniref:F-box domain-containing protein n=1 Tax=Caenorhabditis elegans TaxID=6239 RepID=Q56VY3_CAEEL|nr:F-box domain-containing protein [Caenorhabditis elegans]CAI79283.1 F-box domain-containing protein [Caenorhabditis elegans]|eukprot:NP_001021836.1 Uncharacterized protein CELE_Y87G2A.20 [Caenorhabditis elegans]